MRRRDILNLLGGAGCMLAAGSQVALAAGAQAAASQSPTLPPTLAHTLVLWRKGQAGRRLEVRGRITDAAQKPLQGVEVSVRHAGPDGGLHGRIRRCYAHQRAR